jgi:carbamoyl-phosphate synthase small subunit
LIGGRLVLQCQNPNMRTARRVFLELEDGTRLAGASFGHFGQASGEVVFSTGMVGYVESLTDPSYRGQILVMTYPLIGNYGVPDKADADRFESDRIQVAGLVVARAHDDASHAGAARSLPEWLASEEIPGVEGIDTRYLTLRLREHGTMLGRILPADVQPTELMPMFDPNRIDVVSTVTVKEPVSWDGRIQKSDTRSQKSEVQTPDGGKVTVKEPVSWDGRIQKSDTRSQKSEVQTPDGGKVTVKEPVSWDGRIQKSDTRSQKSEVQTPDGGKVTDTEPVSWDAGQGTKNEERGTRNERRKRVILVDCGVKRSIRRELLARGVEVRQVPSNWDYTGEPFDGILVSNGPGNPEQCPTTIEVLRRAMALGRPILGICLGTQLMALAAGARTYKLRYGHRGQNQPCRESGSDRCRLTSQNHGYAVDARTLPDDWQVWFTNINDGSVEGIRHKRRPFAGVQFHLDSRDLFDRFVESL